MYFFSLNLQYTTDKGYLDFTGYNQRNSE